MNKNNSFFILFACIVMISCGGKSVADNEKFARIDTDTLIQDVPREKNGEIAFEYKTKDTLEERVGLLDLSKGYDSIFIRLYYSYSFSNTSHLVEIFYDKKNQKWQSLIHYLLFEYSVNNTSLSNIQDSVVQSFPKSGWQAMIKKLNALDIFKLQDCRKFKNYVLPMDGAGVTVQVATQNKYRMYSYVMPVLSKDIIPDAKKMVDILDLIEKELGFKQLGKM